MNLATSDKRFYSSREPFVSLLVGITGSVGAVAMPQFVLYLRRRGFKTVQILMSTAACKFVTPYAMRLHSGCRVYTDSFETHSDTSVPHIELTRKSDLFLVMPATANILSKAANGICDDLVSIALVSATCPVMFVPSMNGVMWSNPIVQENVQKLRRNGYRVLEPAEGVEISTLESTHGCMPPLSTVADEIMQVLSAASGDQVAAE